jgi:hypothetical protein
MRALRLAVCLLVGLLLSAGLVVAASRSFHAHASGDQEVPAAVTLAQGQAHFKLSDDGAQLSYKLNVANLDGIRFAHIHIGAAGTNGPVVAFLLQPQSPTTGRVNGTLAEGVITAADLVGPLAGHPLSDLIAALESGDAYVNVHTDAYPGGEIRGQIR